ncbi:hypothetical protein KFK09_003003 [Dendrobium nobile]|uniref:Uncharacterized protein n=1 Tax=Dendrobium nobile TaxID=94219 RepID=A0A8T3C8U7_DENNO|nr:hypothetical protein KFK09_003003 [Dendrobium nobile]
MYCYLSVRPSATEHKCMSFVKLSNLTRNCPLISGSDQLRQKNWLTGFAEEAHERGEEMKFD